MAKRDELYWRMKRAAAKRGLFGSAWRRLADKWAAWWRRTHENTGPMVKAKKE